MKQKRNYMAYSLWFIYSIVIVSFLCFTIFRLSIDFEFNKAASAGITAGAVLICFFIYFMVSKVVPKNQIRVPKALRVLLPVVSVIWIVAIRAIYIIQSAIHLTGNVALYENALVTQGGYKYFSYGESFASGILSDIIHFFAIYLGNREEAAVMAILVISVLTMILLYVAVRKIAGDVAAFLGVTLFFGIMPTVEKLSYVSEIHVNFLLFALLLFLFTLFLKGIINEKCKVFCIIASCIDVVMAGVLFYEEWLMIVLLAIFIFIVMIKGDNSKFGKREFLILTPVLFAAGFLIAAFIVCVVNSMGFVDAIYCKWEELTSLITFIPERLYVSDYAIFIGVALLLSLIWVVWFFRCEKKAQPVYIAFVSLLLFAALYVMGIMGPEYEMLFVFFIMLVLGFCFNEPLYIVTITDEEEEDAVVTEEVIMGDNKIDNTVNTGVITGQDEELQGQPLPAQPLSEQPLPAQPLSAQPLPGQPLHNPLKGPKKHVKKELNYAVEVPEDLMKFDIEITENDDYDIE